MKTLWEIYESAVKEDSANFRAVFRGTELEISLASNPFSATVRYAKTGEFIGKTEKPFATWEEFYQFLDGNMIESPLYTSYKLWLEVDCHDYIQFEYKTCKIVLHKENSGLFVEFRCEGVKERTKLKNPVSEKDFFKTLEELTSYRFALADKDTGLSKNTPADKDTGLRYNEGKTQLELVPPELIEAVGKVMTFGAQKYAPNNWRKFNKKQVFQCIGSAMRHIEAYRKGQWLDEESGLPHLAHAATNLGFILALTKEEE